MNTIGIQLSITVSQDGSRWNTPYGEANFNVNLPADGLSAVDISKLVKPLLVQAQAAYDLKVAEQLAQAENERLQALREANE
jgi:hypothetical protein